MVSKEEISSFVNSEDLNCQSISLPYGIKTPGDSRDEAISIILGELKKSYTVLDVGSLLGLFCLTSLQQGASAVTGLELNRDRLRQAKRIAEFLQLKPNYLRLDIEEFPDLEKHDIVLCLNNLDHLKNPIGVLRYLALHTNDTLIVEAARLGRHNIKSLAKLLCENSKSKSADFRAVALRFVSTFSGTSSAFIAPYSPKSLLRTFFFSKAGLDTILGMHMKLFSSVEIRPSSLKDRYFVVCKKIKIKHLVIVSGTCSSGKSTFIDNFLFTDRSAELGLNKGPFAVVGGTALRSKKLSETFPSQSNDSVVLHYDILSINRFGIHSYDRDTCLDVLKCAQKVSVVLLAPDQATLINQIVSSESDQGDLSRQHGYLREKYNSRSWLREVNVEWIDFLGNSLADVDCYSLYEYNRIANKLKHVQGIDSLRELIEERYSD